MKSQFGEMRVNDALERAEYSRGHSQPLGSPQLFGMGAFRFPHVTGGGMWSQLMEIDQELFSGWPSERLLHVKFENIQAGPEYQIGV